MNNNKPGGNRPQNRRRPTAGRAARPVKNFNPGRTEAEKEYPTTPAWKILVTVLILVLSVAVLLCSIAYFYIPGFFENPIKAIGALFEPDVSDNSNWGDPVNGAPAPIIEGADREQGRYNFLVVGLNADLGNNTDTIMLVQYDVGKSQINVVQIPRDTYIDAGYNFNKINSVFAAAYNSGSGKRDQRRITGMEGDPQNGIMGFCEFVEKAYTVKIDYYVLIDTGAFCSLVDKLGGLRVNVPCRMKYSDPEQDLFIDLYPGEQTLSGYDAMCMVRNRKTYVDADYGRMDAQKIVLSALLKQIKEDFNVNTLKAVIEFAFENVTTNLSLSDCIYFGTQALDVDLSKMNMVTMPTISSCGYISTVETSCVEVINKYINVFDKPITAETFDRDNRLTNTRIKELYGTYLEATVDYTVYDADTVEKDSIKLNEKK